MPAAGIGSQFSWIVLMVGFALGTMTTWYAAAHFLVILGIFLFGTSRVGEFLEKGFTFISVGNDLHHVLTQTGAYVNDMENIAKEKGRNWKRRPTSLF